MIFFSLLAMHSLDKSIIDLTLALEPILLNTFYEYNTRLCTAVLISLSMYLHDVISSKYLDNLLC